MNSGLFTPISDRLQILQLHQTHTDLTSIGNRRFMYHSSGILILGDEDRLHPGNNLYSSHSEEFAQAQNMYERKLPVFDSFCRGWIGNSKEYPYGIIHFAPAISPGYLPHYEAAFDFIEASLQNGLTEQAVLRGFCDRWEQTIAHMLDHEHKKEHPTLDRQIQSAVIRTQTKSAGEGRGLPLDGPPRS